MSEDRYSYRDMIQRIRKLYLQNGFDLTAETPGERVYQEFGSEVASCRSGAVYALLDECIYAVRCLSYYFFIAGLRKNNDALIYRRLADGMLSSLVSVRMMTSAGLDTYYRVQITFLYELSIRC
jgi:hypothetical protein